MEKSYDTWKDENHQYSLRLFNIKKPGEPPTLIFKRNYFCSVLCMKWNIKSLLDQQVKFKTNYHCEAVIAFKNFKGDYTIKRFSAYGRYCIKNEEFI